MSKYVMSMKEINYDEFEKARDEVREHISSKLFDVRFPDDLQERISGLPAIQKEYAFSKLSQTYNALDEICREKGYGAAYLKGRETEVFVRDKIQIEDINIRDLFTITALCNKIISIISKDVDEYDICALLVAIDSIVENPSSIQIEDSDPWI